MNEFPQPTRIWYFFNYLIVKFISFKSHYSNCHYDSYNNYQIISFQASLHNNKMFQVEDEENNDALVRTMQASSFSRCGHYLREVFNTLFIPGIRESARKTFIRMIPFVKRQQTYLYSIKQKRKFQKRINQKLRKIMSYPNTYVKNRHDDYQIDMLKGRLSHLKRGIHDGMALFYESTMQVEMMWIEFTREYTGPIDLNEVNEDDYLLPPINLNLNEGIENNSQLNPIYLAKKIFKQIKESEQIEDQLESNDEEPEDNLFDPINFVEVIDLTGDDDDDDNYRPQLNIDILLERLTSNPIDEILLFIMSI